PLTIDNTDRIRASDIEFRLTQPSYTIDTLIHLKERYPTKDFVLIMGSDNLVTLKKWKNYEIILRDFFVYVYPRPGYDVGEWAEHPRITFTETPLMEISSTFIRNAIKDHKSVKYFLPDKVLDFIDKKGIYL
ncbi:nicotinate-nicotinamide nucleotide adenylyltransferase, partial [Brucella intermedia]|uniref:nicotinate-nicotinamide nucleotide adenylyltransferase n=1 Tax=Brucella intermedia TaxID=94625 RepID=UPI003F16F6D5